MPYTNSWSSGEPLGSELAKNIDDFIRKLALNVEERLLSVYTDLDLDPLVPILGGSGIGKILIPHAAFLSDLNDKENDISDLYIVGFVGHSKLYAPVILPNGATITKIEHNIDLDAAASVTIKLMFNDFTNPPVATSTSINTLTTGAGGLQTLDSGAVSLATDADKMYFIEVSSTGVTNNTYKVFGSRISYTF